MAGDQHHTDTNLAKCKSYKHKYFVRAKVKSIITIVWLGIYGVEERGLTGAVTEKCPPPCWAVPRDVLGPLQISILRPRSSPRYARVVGGRGCI